MRADSQALELDVNGERLRVHANPSMPLLWVLRDRLNLTGTKYGCGIAACGACTVLVDGAPVRSCSRPVSTILGQQVMTIEAVRQPGQLDPHRRALAALRAAWIEEQVPQCGYCQSGMLMAAAALLVETPNPDDATIASVMTNLCRCGTYQRVRDAIRNAAGQLARGA